MNPQPKKKRIKLSKQEYHLLRVNKWNAQYRKCARCHQFTPFEQFHLHHKKTRGSGGGDTEENTEGLCYICHSIEHGPKWKWIK